MENEVNFQGVTYASKARRFFAILIDNFIIYFFITIVTCSGIGANSATGSHLSRIAVLGYYTVL